MPAGTHIPACSACCLALDPIVAEAIFLNREELPVLPVYYDPVHDFGFMRFDPSKLMFMKVRWQLML